LPEVPGQNPSRDGGGSAVAKTPKPDNRSWFRSRESSIRAAA